MKKSRPKRPSADKTRDKILHTALQLFMQHGFAGTSMGELAKKANINQTLIFHHFGNKQQLWQQVKATILDNANATPINAKPISLLQFLQEAFEQRLSIYTKCPQLKRLIQWQKLENSPKKVEMVGTPNSFFSPLKWIDSIKFLQSNKMLNPHLKPELVLIWLASSIDGMISDDLILFKNNQQNQNEYKNMVIKGLAQGLA